MILTRGYTRNYPLSLITHCIKDRQKDEYDTSCIPEPHVVVQVHQLNDFPGQELALDTFVSPGWTCSGALDTGHACRMGAREAATKRDHRSRAYLLRLAPVLLHAHWDWM